MPRIAGHFFIGRKLILPVYNKTLPKGGLFCKWRAVEGVLCAPLELHRRS